MSGEVKKELNMRRLSISGKRVRSVGIVTVYRDLTLADGRGLPWLYVCTPYSGISSASQTDYCTVPLRACVTLRLFNIRYCFSLTLINSVQASAELVRAGYCLLVTGYRLVLTMGDLM